MGPGTWEDGSAGRPPEDPGFLVQCRPFPYQASAGPTARVPHPTSLDKLSAWMRGGDKGLGFPCTHPIGPSQPCTLWSSTWVSLMDVSIPTRLPVQEDLRSSATQPTLSLPGPHHARSMYSRSKAWVISSVSWGLRGASLATRKAESGSLQETGASSTKDQPKHICKAVAVCPSFCRRP